MLDNRYYFVDDEGIPIKATDILVWARQCSVPNSRVAQTTLAGGVVVSTIFTGLNCICPKLPPVVFETAVFKDGETGVVRRYSTWDEAEAGHAEECRQLRKAGDDG